MSCYRGRITRALHVLTGIPHAKIASFVDTTVHARLPSPMTLVDDIAQHLFPASTNDAHDTTGHTILAQTILLAVRQSMNDSSFLSRFKPRLVALAHVILAHPASFGIPPVAPALIQRIRHDVACLPDPKPLPDPLPTEDDDLVQALIAARRHGATIPTDVLQRLTEASPTVRGRLILAGILPFPRHPDPWCAGVLLGSGYWDEAWVKIAEQDVFALAWAMEAYPHLHTEARVRSIAQHPESARHLLLRYPALLRYESIIQACSQWPTLAREVLTTHANLPAPSHLIHAVARDPQMARDVLIARPDLRTRQSLLRAVARDFQSARDVLIHCPDLRTNGSLLHAVSFDSVTVRDVLLACREVRDDPLFWACLARDPRVLAPALQSDPSLLRHPMLLAMLRGAIDPWSPTPLSLPSPSERISHLIACVGPHPVLWSQLSEAERLAWIHTHKVPVRAVQWLNTLAARAEREPFVWYAADAVAARRFRSTRTLLSWMRHLNPESHATRATDDS